jgi:hypothetical protein
MDRATGTGERNLHPADWFNPPERFGDEYLRFLLEQYKLYVETTNKISDRRGNAHTLLLTVNTSLVTVYGLVLGKDPIDKVQGPWTWLVPIAGLIVAITWFLLIRYYRSLNSAKFEVIHQVETRLPIRLFDLEWQYLGRGRTWRHVPLTHVEQYIPVAFGSFYIALLAVAAHVL